MSILHNLVGVEAWPPKRGIVGVDLAEEVLLLLMVGLFRVWLVGCTPGAVAPALGF